LGVIFALFLAQNFKTKVFTAQKNEGAVFLGRPAHPAATSRLRPSRLSQVSSLNQFQLNRPEGNSPAGRLATAGGWVLPGRQQEIATKTNSTVFTKDLPNNCNITLEVYL
jgi:hypothetical protein